ncbi:MAG: hypothetical protein IV100_17005 [Myxococcales bacterium]|nr:hypothetical protein [Myxococcales bacterium]
MKRCVRCQEAIRLEAMAAEALSRVRPALSMAARARIAEAAALESRRQRRRARSTPMAPGRMTLALAASVVLSIGFGGLVAQARDAIEPPTPPQSAETAASTPLLEALLAHHQNGDVPLPAGVRFATRLPETLAVEAVPSELLSDRTVTAAHALGDETASGEADYDDPALFCECGVTERATMATSFFVLDRKEVDVDSDLEAEMAAEGSAVVHFGTSRVTVTSRDQELFVTIATTKASAVVAARYL